jgi:hypothetical protein
MTRLCKIKGRHNFIGGKDNDNIFEEGVVYSVQKILDNIVITPIGKQPEVDSYGDKISMQHIEEVIINGDYLIPKDDK